jgi:phenylacetate-CoA ligase
MDAMEVFAEAAPNATSDADRAASAKALTEKIKNIVGVSTKVSVGNPGTVERSQGKARRVIDKRPKE